MLELLKPPKSMPQSEEYYAALKLRGVLSASIGIAQFVPDPSSTLSIDLEKGELLRRADAAMYRAKSLGKNQYVVWDQTLALAKGGELSPR